MNNSAYLLETCRGVKPGGCANALALPEGFAADLAGMIAGMAPPPFLAGLTRPIRHHERFRLAVSACANGCARPHVADLGLIMAVGVAVDGARCAGCEACVGTCPDDAVTMADGVAVIDASRCLGCGRCAAVCPERAIAARERGFRALLGGRLGRRPRLAAELPGLASPEAVLRLAQSCFTLFQSDFRPGLRFADLLHPGGLPGLPGWVVS